MNNLNEKLANFSIEKLEERKEFTFYCNPKPWCQPQPSPPSCPPTTTPITTPLPTDPGTGGGGL